jgi:hypothetical protein
LRRRAILDWMNAPLPPPHSALAASIGPFYRTKSVQALLGGLSEQAVTARREAHTILAMQTADRRWVYPSFQFSGSDVHPALLPAIRALRNTPAWSAALWFVTPNPDLDGTPPLEWALAGRSTDRLVATTQRTAREWQ